MISQVLNTTICERNGDGALSNWGWDREARADWSFKTADTSGLTLGGILSRARGNLGTGGIFMANKSLLVLL